MRIDKRAQRVAQTGATELIENFTPLRKTETCGFFHAVVGVNVDQTTALMKQKKVARCEET